MKRLFPLLLLVLFAAPVGASEKYLCTVTSTNPTAGTTNSPSAGTCSWAKGAEIAVQCDVAIHYDASGTATTDDVKIDFAANPDPFRIDLHSDEKAVSILSVSGAATCRFFIQRK